MSTAPTPEEIYERSKQEGRRRLSMSGLDLVSTGFIAGFTIVFGVVGLGVVESLVEPAAGRALAQLAGALAFAIGLVFLVVGRSELFTENFFDPVAAAISERGRKVWLLVARLWVVILVLNMVGAAVLAAVFTVDGALPEGAPEALSMVAEEIAAKSGVATFARAVAAGALITLLSYLLQGVDSVLGRITVAYMVGFFVALGPFDHVVVSAAHLLLGVWFDGHVGYGDVLLNMAISTPGNLVGGVVLVTLTHAAQAKGA
ncbi:MAG TPA: formate/nitrite transporter family protein [Acidimicrobiales bacterium]|nr:formate/nitrite transporter family protein [Acidimicrobiales bacterium]